MLAGVRDYVAALKKAGRTLQEAVAAKPTAAYDAKWGPSKLSLSLVAPDFSASKHFLFCSERLVDSFFWLGAFHLPHVAQQLT
jgi:hypothetical protein